MNTPSVEQLNKQFSFQDGSDTLRFKAGRGDIPVIEIRNKQACVTISLQGAHLLSWVPAGQGEVIWLSEDAMYTTAKSVRGGVPVCWPWFGAHDNNASCPAHGFARNVLWQVANTQQTSAGETEITFRLNTVQLDEKYQRMWPQATLAEYRITVAKTLKLELTTVNKSDQAITIGQALHTYFNVEDIGNTVVLGLEGKDYLDKTDGFNRKEQTGPVTINTEVDRVYLQTPEDVIIDDKTRKIIIKKQGSQSTVIWNPWKSAADKTGDMGKDGYLGMLCVESANVAEDTISIKPGESHTLAVIYEIEDTS